MSEFRTLPWLHIYAQESWHRPATIEGTRQGLTALRDAIDAALKGIDAEARLFAGDGEGYQARIRICSYEHLESGKFALPYYDDIASCVEAGKRMRP